MAVPVPQARLYRFAPFELDVRAGELRKHGIRIKLSEQPVQILLMLLDRPGEVVLREEIRQRLWPNNTIVEFDHGINAAIQKLRDALGDSAASPRHVETVARRGYRFLGEVERVDAPLPDPRPPAPPIKAADPGEPAPPRVLAHYRILDKIGEGGMGEVYRASDTKLGRDVAVKFLSPDFAHDPEWLTRFEREAKVLASLNHANIAAIYALEEGALVMELVEGGTLKGPLPLETALDYARQIAAALEAAHEKGIVHRDLKPANIMVKSDGAIKVLDFGLAKSVELPTVNEQNSPSRAGVILGTAAYMSPEQALGKPVDKRADIWSFGVVLWEMLTGRRLFEGETVTQILAAVLRAPIEFERLPRETPGAIRQLLRRCLDRDPGMRLRDIGEARVAIQNGDQEPAAAVPAVQTAAQMVRAGLRMMLLGIRNVTRRTLLYGVGVLAVLLAIISIWALRERSSQPRIPTERQLTRNTPENRALGGEISPDGKRLAYVDTLGVHVRNIDTGETHDIAVPADLRTRLWDVKFFADGEKLLLLSSAPAELWTTSIFGDTPRKLRTQIRNAVVSPDGALIAFKNLANEIWIMRPGGEDARKVVDAKRNERVSGPVWSPSSRRLAYIRANTSQSSEWWGGTLETVDLDGRAPTTVISDKRLSSSGHYYFALAWIPDGRLLFVLRDEDDASAGEMGRGNIWAIQMEPRTGARIGKPRQITHWPGILPLLFSVSRDGRRMVAAKSHDRSYIYFAEFQENGELAPERQLTSSDSSDYSSAWTVDGESVLFVSNRTGKPQIFKQRLGQNTAEMLTQPLDIPYEFGSSPDGNWFFYPRSIDGRIWIMRLASSGGSTEQLFEIPAGPWGADCSIQPGGICVLSHVEQGHAIFNEFDARGLGKKLRQIEWTAGARPGLSVSPNGGEIAVFGQKGQIRILDLRNEKDRIVGLPAGWGIANLQFTADGKALIANGGTERGYSLMRIEFDGKGKILRDQGRNHVIENPRPSPNGNYLAWHQKVWDVNFWLLENF